MCAFALTLGMVGLSEARGSNGTTLSRSAPLIVFVKPATPQSPAAICPYAVLFTGEIARQQTLACPDAALHAVTYARTDAVLPVLPTHGTPFRPPRQG